MINFINKIGICRAEHVHRLEKAIANGIPLPNGHGRLIDADALNEPMKQRHYENADEESYWIADVIETALNPNNGYAPTIIEADKEVDE